MYDEKKNKWINGEDIIEIIDEFKNLSKVKHLDKNLDLKFIIHRARCKILHTGEFVGKFATLPLKENDNKYIATFILDFSKFLSKKYLKDNKMDKNYCLDAHEVFQNDLIKFETIESKLKKLINSKNIK